MSYIQGEIIHSLSYKYIRTCVCYHQLTHYLVFAHSHLLSHMCIKCGEIWEHVKEELSYQSSPENML
jgi:hypothetical protein